ncbi:hypothetical protein TNCV_4575651 [Trichonephila clavipes]|nr:hypothetical protein TNCV_4575651 [Trichonephila clavipes]
MQAELESSSKRLLLNEGRKKDERERVEMREKKVVDEKFNYQDRYSINIQYGRLRGLEVAYPLFKPMVAGSVLAGVDRFSGCENYRHACHMNMCHAKHPSSINLALVLSAELNHGNS